ncbi:MAG: D-alanyl-D-alanine carboxypeptidase, partial [Hyphomicrobium sp.]
MCIRDRITTARDLAKLSRAVVIEFPEYASYWTMTDMRIGNKRLGSHNALLKTYPGADGLKTGFTCDSGFNVVASATRDGRRIMAVVLGETSGNERAVRAASLLEHGFQTASWKDLFSQISIDNMPMDPAAKGVTTVREQVVAWDCGNGRRRAKPTVASRNKALKAKVAAAKAKAGAKKKDDLKDASPVLKGTQLAPGMSAEPPAAKAAAAKPN